LRATTALASHGTRRTFLDFVSAMTCANARADMAIYGRENHLA
jgi:hypothetical protein